MAATDDIPTVSEEVDAGHLVYPAVPEQWSEFHGGALGRSPPELVLTPTSTVPLRTVILALRSRALLTPFVQDRIATTFGISSLQEIGDFNPDLPWQQAIDVLAESIDAHLDIHTLSQVHYPPRNAAAAIWWDQEELRYAAQKKVEAAWILKTLGLIGPEENGTT